MKYVESSSMYLNVQQKRNTTEGKLSRSNMPGHRFHPPSSFSLSEPIGRIKKDYRATLYIKTKQSRIEEWRIECNVTVQSLDLAIPQCPLWFPSSAHRFSYSFLPWVSRSSPFRFQLKSFIVPSSNLFHSYLAAWSPPRSIPIPSTSRNRTLRTF